MVRISLVPVLTPLYLYVSTFWSMCAVSNMTVFRSSLNSWFPGMLLTYFVNDFKMVPVAPIIAGITFVFTFHMRCISIVRALYFRIFSALLLLLLPLYSVFKIIYQKQTMYCRVHDVTVNVIVMYGTCQVTVVRNNRFVFFFFSVVHQPKSV